MSTFDSDRQLNLKVSQSGDPLHLQNFDYPGMTLASSSLTWKNYNSKKSYFMKMYFHTTKSQTNLFLSPFKHTHYKKNKTVSMPLLNTPLDRLLFESDVTSEHKSIGRIINGAQNSDMPINAPKITADPHITPDYLELENTLPSPVSRDHTTPENTPPSEIGPMSSEDTQTCEVLPLNESTQPQNATDPPIRTSSKTKRPPSWLSDFIFSTNVSSYASELIADSNIELHQQSEFSQEHLCFLSNIKPIHTATMYY